MRTSLYSLFAPPRDCFGDFGLLCGFTASRQVLSRLRSTFSGDKEHPVLAAFLHPTADALSNVPGLAWMWMKRRDYALLHAKVALLGFRRNESERYVIRLAVSTGNWTEDPLKNSIDMFWHIDVDTDAPGAQDVADVRAAWALFEWLRDRADVSLIERDYDGRRQDARLRTAIDGLPRSRRTPRFIDSRTQALMPQIVERMPKRAKRLIVGSGYFEAPGEDGGVVERLRSALVGKRPAALDLVLNPDACQGLASRAAALEAAGWRFRAPFSPVHDIGAKLHAKFVVADAGEKTWRGRIYLGSGNISRAGLESIAERGGNLKAGVVVDLPEGWRDRQIQALLPIRFDSAVEPQQLAPGQDFVPPPEPPPPPPVSWLCWEGGVLSAPEGQVIPVIGPDGVVATTPMAWPGLAPATVTLSGSGWRLPVIAEGVLVSHLPSETTVDDVLARIGSFPQAPEDEPEGSDTDGKAGDDNSGGNAGEGNASGNADEGNTGDKAGDGGRRTQTRGIHQVYPIRRMMRLIVNLGEAQKTVACEDWPRWCRELAQMLRAITPQEQLMIGYFREAGVNPLPVLSDPRLRKSDCDAARLDTALADVAEEWGLATLPSLWDRRDS